MADCIKRIRTTSGDLQIDYNSLANLPDLSDIASADHTHELKDLAGVASIKQGGTGATDAATARNNLEITPVNIGALPASGGNMTGGINFGNGTRGLEWTTADGTRFSLRPYAEGNLFQITRTPPGGTEVSELAIDNNGCFTFGAERQPLPIVSGGTGASDAAGACANIGALPASGGKMTGFAEVDSGSYAGMRWYCDDGSRFDLRAIGPTNVFQLTLTPKDGSEFGVINIDTDGVVNLSGALPISSGGTGANNSADARNKLEITPANIGAATSDHTHTLENLGVIYSETEPTNRAGVIWLKPVE